MAETRVCCVLSRLLCVALQYWAARPPERSGAAIRTAAQQRRISCRNSLAQAPEKSARPLLDLRPRRPFPGTVQNPAEISGPWALDGARASLSATAEWHNTQFNPRLARPDYCIAAPVFDIASCCYPVLPTTSPNSLANKQGQDPLGPRVMQQALARHSGGGLFDRKPTPR